MRPLSISIFGATPEPIQFTGYGGNVFWVDSTEKRSQYIKQTEK